jgi:hypothetical protein
MKHPIQKIIKAKRGGVMAEVVDHLPSKCKAMSSNPSTAKKKKKKVLESQYTCLLSYFKISLPKVNSTFILAVCVIPLLSLSSQEQETYLLFVYLFLQCWGLNTEY